ncbi:MAG: FHA domain-containing protein [Anaerolineaceae bacterium]|nr:FHA domain-containing protein [Anaerolineaceae bacterium]
MTGFQLVMRSGPTPGKVFPLQADELFIGRDVGNDIVINDAEISRRHSRLAIQAGGYILEDLGSTNGTAVNGERLTSRHVMRVGEVISLGEHVALVFESVADDKEATVVGQRTVRKPTPESGQVTPAPARPEVSVRQSAAPVVTKKKFPTWLIVLVIVLAVLCLCVALPVMIDYLNMWCSIPLINGILGCP